MAAVNPYSAFLITRMAVWVALLPLLLRLFSVATVVKLATPRSRPARLSASDKERRQHRIGELADMLLRLDFLFFTPTCWKRAIVLYRFLALNGIETHVVFGVRQSEGELKGHAWLETSDGPILETIEPDYARTFAYP